MKRILVLGGTGAMGIPCVELLSKCNLIYVTSRSKHQSSKNIHYIEGNAKDPIFLKEILREHWDGIVDFMVYSTKEFSERVDDFLNATDQYVFLSSARVFKDCKYEKIEEDSPRILDTTEDEEYLLTDEYALAKARQENLLFNSGRNNWTIVRPSLTYNTYKLQLGAYEKENWLYRVLMGRTLVFSEDLMDIAVSLNFGDDVAKAIASLVGDSECMGKTFNVVGNESHTWGEVFKWYLDVFEEHNIKPKILITPQCTNLDLPNKQYKILYGRFYNRVFDNSKITTVFSKENWSPVQESLKACLSDFLDKPKFGKINWKKEALIDKAANEKTPLKEIPGLRSRITYLCYRNNLRIIDSFFDRLIIRIMKHK